MCCHIEIISEADPIRNRDPNASSILVFVYLFLRMHLKYLFLFKDGRLLWVCGSERLGIKEVLIKVLGFTFWLPSFSSTSFF